MTAAASFLRAALYLGLCAVIVSCAPEAWAEPAEEGVLMPVGIDSPTFDKVGPGGMVWQQEVFQRSEVEFFRLHFTNIKVTNASQATLTILDRNLATLATYDLRTFSRSPQLWTGVLPGGYALLRLSVAAGASPPASLSFRVEEVGVESRGGRVLSHQDPRNPQERDLFEFAGDANIVKSARSVAKLSFPIKGKLASCTGFMVTADLLITNHHCVSTAEACDGTVALFDFEYASAGQLKRPQQFHCLSVVDSDEALDFALLFLDGSPGAPGKFGVLPFAKTFKNQKGQALYVIEHPFGQPKMVAKKGCSLSTPRDATGAAPAARLDLGHVCDTENGSSGSPVLDERHQVIGLHHLGFESGRWARENRAVASEALNARLAKFIAAR
jgi:S1-C subfamily serine protease